MGPGSRDRHIDAVWFKALAAKDLMTRFFPSPGFCFLSRQNTHHTYIHTCINHGIARLNIVCFRAGGRFETLNYITLHTC